MLLSLPFNTWSNELLGSTKKKINRDEYGENIPHLEFTEALLHRNIVSNDCHQGSGVVYTFVHNKSVGQLLDISPKISYF